MTAPTTTYTLLSKKGMKELRKSIERLEREQKLAISSLRDIEKTHSHEDQLERVERLSHLESIESELQDKQTLLRQSRLIPSRRTRLKVAIGSVVDLLNQEGQLVRYTLVDSIEANPSDGRISTSSPLGSSLLGKTAEDIIEWGRGARRQQLQLVRIH